MGNTRTKKDKLSFRIIVNGREPNNLEFWLYYIWRLLSLGVIVVTVFALSENINCLIAEWSSKLASKWTSNPIDIYSLLNNHPKVNLFFFIWLLIGIALYVKKNWNNKYFSLVGIGVAVISGILVLRQDVWIYAKTPLQKLGYDWFVAFIAGGFVLWSLFRCVSLKRVDKRQTGKIVMTSDEIKGVRISSARQAYANMLVDELLASNLRNETYAVAITGSWGSGKSLFLDTVKSLFKGKAKVIDFNPWNSQSADHLVKDFFDLLSAELSPNYGGVKRTMDKYVSLLYSLRFHVADNFIFQHFPGSVENSLEAKKQEVANALRSIPEPIVVIIDDLDRLAGKEIYEVLRIIRNTAKFNNIIYIVAYDKEHVVSQIKQPGMSIEKDYLEKIFQIELSMPNMDEKELEMVFRRLCRAGVKSKSQMDAALESLTGEDFRWILKTLWSFRKVKRFVRQFSFNVNFMIESFIDGRNLPIKDVLFLNLIQSLDYQLYRKMCLTPETLFEVKTHPNTKCRYYALRSKVGENSSLNYFLEQLFGDAKNTDSNGIQRVDSYYKYFYLSQPERSLSMDEFNKMLEQPSGENATAGMKATIRSWVLSRNAKNASSIYNCFVNSNAKIHDELAEATSFLKALFYWLEYEDRVGAKLEDVLPILLQKCFYTNNITSQLDACLNSLLNKWLAKGGYLKCAKILSRLYVEVEGGAKLLLDKHKIEKAIDTNINLFLKSQKWDAVLLFKTDDNPMLRMVKTYCVKLPGNGRRVNLVLDRLIAFFSIPENVSLHLNQVDYYRSAFDSYELFGKGASTIVDWDEMRSIFGNDLSKAIDYIDKCFRSWPSRQ